MLYRAIKYQVDKGPVDAVTGKAKRTLNDSHLLREDIDFCTMVTPATHTSHLSVTHTLDRWKTRWCNIFETINKCKPVSLSTCLSPSVLVCICLPVPVCQTLTVLVKNGVEVQPCPVKVLDTDTITQVGTCPSLCTCLSDYQLHVLLSPVSLSPVCLSV